LTALRQREVWAAALLLLCACSTVPYTQRSRLVTIPEAEEIALGEAAFREVVESSVPVDDDRAALIRRVGARIAAAAARPGFRWEFLLVESAEVNAFALPGGKVVFHTGILPYCEGEEGVAVVMAHEVAHVLARHGAERLTEARLLELGRTALSAAFAGASPAVRRGVLGAYGLGGRVGITLPFSRRHEAEADAIGLVLMAKAGYDPRAAPAFWRRLLAAGEGEQAPELLSTHPGERKRLQTIEDLLPIALEHYRAKAEGAGAARPAEEKPPPPPEEILRRLREDTLP